MAHRILWISGFEDEQISRIWSSSGSAATLDSFACYSRKSVYWDGVAGAVNGWLSNSHAPYTNNDFEWMSFCFYIDALPVTATIWRLWTMVVSGGGVDTRIDLRPDGKLNLVNAGVSNVSTEALEEGKWYTCSIQWHRNSTFRVIVRSVLTGATVLDKTHANSVGNLEWFSNSIGPFVASRGKVHYDNVIFEGDDTAATNVDDPILLVGVRHAIGMPATLTGDGFYDAWTGSNGDVEETPADDATTYRSDTGNGTKFTAPHASITTLFAPVAAIHATQHWLRARWQSSTNASGSLLLRSGSTDFPSADGPTGTTWVFSPVAAGLRTTDPATSAPWTITAFEACEVGCQKDVTTGILNVTQVGIEVLYSVGEVERVRRIKYAIEDFDPLRRVLDLERGEFIEPEEVDVNVGWLRTTTSELPSLPSSNNAWDDPTLVPIESVRYRQSAEGITLTIEPAADRFAENLASKLSDSVTSI